jgi:hypothetical protein
MRKPAITYLGKSYRLLSSNLSWKSFVWCGGRFSTHDNETLSMNFWKRPMAWSSGLIEWVVVESYYESCTGLITG